jgi:hypothetical protein
METIEINGMTMPVSDYRELNGQKVPIIKAKAEEIKRSDGRIDVIVKVPCLELLAQKDK